MFDSLLWAWVLGTGDYPQIVTKRESDYIQSLLYYIS